MNNDGHSLTLGAMVDPRDQLVWISSWESVFVVFSHERFQFNRNSSISRGFLTELRRWGKQCTNPTLTRFGALPTFLAPMAVDGRLRRYFDEKRAHDRQLFLELGPEVAIDAGFFSPWFFGFTSVFIGFVS
jgi:hypothetical protein